MKCNLCREGKTLKKSHVIPKAYYKAMKRKGGANQLLNVTVKDGVKPVYCNSDPKEYLLCGDCEQLLNERYEMYGTSVLRSRKYVVKLRRYIAVEQFNFKKFYLYAVSILWRASISTVDDFNAVSLGEGLNEIVRGCILESSLETCFGINLNDLIKISVIRIVDKKDELSDDVIKGVLLNPNKETRKAPDDGVVFYFMVEGFFFCYTIEPYKNLDGLLNVRTTKKLSEITERDVMYISKVDLRKIKQVQDAFLFISKQDDKQMLRQ